MARSLSIDADCQAVVLDEGGVEPLVRAMRDASFEVREQAARALSRLATNNAKAQAAIAASGGIEPLILTLGAAAQVKKGAAGLVDGGEAASAALAAAAAVNAAEAAALAKAHRTGGSLHAAASSTGGSPGAALSGGVGVGGAVANGGHASWAAGEEGGSPSSADSTGDGGGSGEETGGGGEEATSPAGGIDGLAVVALQQQEEGGAEEGGAEEGGAGEVDVGVLELLERLREAIRAAGIKVIDLFREWDADGNGALDKAEVRTAATRLLAQSNEATVEPLIRDVDALFDSIDVRASHPWAIRLRAALTPLPLATRVTAFLFASAHSAACFEDV